MAVALVLGGVGTGVVRGTGRGWRGGSMWASRGCGCRKGLTSAWKCPSCPRGSQNSYSMPGFGSWNRTWSVEEGENSLRPLPGRGTRPRETLGYNPPCPATGGCPTAHLGEQGLLCRVRGATLTVTYKSSRVGPAASRLSRSSAARA